MIAIVTDSSVSISKHDAQKLGIKLVPMNYTVHGQLYQETYSDKNGDFEKVIGSNTNNCTTAQASVSAFMSTFEELIRQDYEVLCIVMSSRLSGTYGSASLAAREVNSRNIVVVDSLTTAGGLNLLVRKAKELVDNGLSLKQVALEVENYRSKVGIAFSVDDMDALRRSGRLGIVRQSVGTILNIRPILLCDDGAVVSDGISRGKLEQARQLVKRIPENPKKLIVHYLGDVAKIEPLLNEIKDKYANVDKILCRIGPVLGIHLGFGVIGVAWICE